MKHGVIQIAIGVCLCYSILYRRTQRSSFQLNLWVGGHLVQTDFHSNDPSELNQWLLSQYNNYFLTRENPWWVKNYTKKTLFGVHPTLAGRYQ